MARRTWKLSDEAKENHRKSTKRLWEDAEYREKIVNGLKGHSVSEEVREKIAAPKRGKPLTEEHKAKLRAASKRLWQSDEYRNKVVSRINDPEVKSKINTPERSAKISASKKEYWANIPEDMRSEKIDEWTREARLEAIALRQPTSIELAVKSILDDWTIEYVTQKHLGPFLVDFFIPSQRLVIECDGDYWHGRPDAKERDQRKNDWLEKHRYNLVRLSETEIKANVRLAVETALKLKVQVD